MRSKSPVKALIVCVFIVFLFLTVEAGLRLLLCVTGRGLPKTSIARMSADPRLGWELNTDHEEINSLGMRDRERSPEKRAGVIRVLCVGDSLTYGSMVGREEAYPAVLEGLLSGRLGPGRAEVLNAGVMGYSTDQELAYLEARGLLLQPDIVIVGFVLNDVIRRYRRPARWSSFPASVFLEKNWALYYCLKSAYLKVRKEISSKKEHVTVAELAAGKSGSPPVAEEAWLEAEADLAAMAELSGRSGARFMVIIFPVRSQLAGPPGEACVQNRILDFCRRRDIPAIDLLTIFRGRGDALFIDDMHFTPEGNAAVAVRIFDALTRWGLIQAGA